MKKMMSALLLGLLLAGPVTSAMAAPVASITTRTMTRVVSVKAADGTDVGPSLVIRAAEDEEAVHRASEILQRIYEQTNSERILLIDFFGEAAKTDIIKLFPVDFDMSNLKMYEFVLCEVFNYDPKYGNLIVEMEFVTPYQEGQPLAVVVGIGEDENEIEWLALKAEVRDGEVNIDFPGDVLARIRQNFLLGVLSEAHSEAVPK